MSMKFDDRLSVPHSFPPVQSTGSHSVLRYHPHQRDSNQCLCIQAKFCKSAHCLQEERSLHFKVCVTWSWSSCSASLACTLHLLRLVSSHIDPPWFFLTFKSPGDAARICETVTSFWNTLLSSGILTNYHSSFRSRINCVSPIGEATPAPQVLLPSAYLLCVFYLLHITVNNLIFILKENIVRGMLSSVLLPRKVVWGQGRLDQSLSSQSFSFAELY